jgi:ElaB/YqjD/DUF883 family membrane-anchored ribosome-binding protein
MATQKERDQDEQERERPEAEPGQGKGRQEVDFESLREHGRALRDAAGELREATQQALADAESIARSGVRERPYTMLGAAFAAGWVLGGGLPVRLASLATGAVGRAALGLAAARLAEFQANGSGTTREQPPREASKDGGRTRYGTRESDAHAGM